MIEGIFTPYEFYFTPTAALCAGVCENPECNHIHGWQFIFQWFWWGFMVTWGFEEDAE